MPAPPMPRPVGPARATERRAREPGEPVGDRDHGRPEQRRDREVGDDQRPVLAEPDVQGPEQDLGRAGAARRAGAAGRASRARRRRLSRTMIAIVAAIDEDPVGEVDVGQPVVPEGQELAVTAGRELVTAGEMGSGDVRPDLVDALLLGPGHVAAGDDRAEEQDRGRHGVGLEPTDRRLRTGCVGLDGGLGARLEAEPEQQAEAGSSRCRDGPPPALLEAVLDRQAAEPGLDQDEQDRRRCNDRGRPSRCGPGGRCRRASRAARSGPRRPPQAGGARTR